MDSTGQILPAQTIRTYEEYKNQTRTVSNELGKDEFLQLLAAQLQYQNPLEPMKDTEFIAQLAQFSSLQQMQSLTSFQYFNLAGKYVSARATLEDGSRSTIYGLVDFVQMKNSKPYAQIGEYLVDATEIIEVFDSNVLSGNNQLIEAAALIGCTIKAKVTEGETYKEVSGTVNRVAVENQMLVVYTDGFDSGIPIGNIYDIQKFVFEGDGSEKEENEVDQTETDNSNEVIEGGNSL